MSTPVWILDNSVIVKWFFTNEHLAQKAHAVQQTVVSNPHQFVIPTLCYTELVHVLCRKSQNDVDFVSQCMDRFIRLNIRSINSVTHESTKRVVKFTCDGFTGYDATYLALAQELDGKWLTADLKAVSKESHRYSIYLGDW